jgi:hypothetical protein
MSVSEDTESPFLSSVLDGDEWSASRLGHFISREKSPRYPLDRRLVGPHNPLLGYEEKMVSSAGKRT